MFKSSIVTCVLSVSYCLLTLLGCTTCKKDVSPSLFPEEQRISNIYDRVARSVVLIKNKRKHPTMGVATYCMGSGYVVSCGMDKIIVTNYHVVDLAYSVWVVINEQEWEADFVGGAKSCDIAIIRIKNPAILQHMPSLTFGSSADLKVGQDVYTLGYPFALPLTMTRGIVSGLNRRVCVGDDIDMHGCIQIDSAVNPGSSGGAVLNSRGELIGMATMIMSRGGDFCGIAFAIPSDLIRTIVDSIMEEYNKMLIFFHNSLDY